MLLFCINWWRNKIGFLNWKDSGQINTLSSQWYILWKMPGVWSTAPALEVLADIPQTRQEITQLAQRFQKILTQQPLVLAELRINFLTLTGNRQCRFFYAIELSILVSNISDLIFKRAGRSWNAMGVWIGAKNTKNSVGTV